MLEIRTAMLYRKRDLSWNPSHNDNDNICGIAIMGDGRLPLGFIK